jgi:hypothetical protein
MLFIYIAPSEAKNPTTSSSICVGLQITVANSVPFTLSIIRYEEGQLIQTTDSYVTEFPLTINVNGTEFANV